MLKVLSRGLCSLDKFSLLGYLKKNKIIKNLLYSLFPAEKQLEQ